MFLCFKVIAKDTNKICYTVTYILKPFSSLYWGVTLAQLVKASVGHADVQRLEPHLGHNWLSCSVFLVKSICPKHKAKLAISLSGWLGRYKNMEYLQSLYLQSLY